MVTCCLMKQEPQLFFFFTNSHALIYAGCHATPIGYWSVGFVKVISSWNNSKWNKYSTTLAQDVTNVAFKKQRNNTKRPTVKSISGRVWNLHHLHAVHVCLLADFFFFFHCQLVYWVQNQIPISDTMWNQQQDWVLHQFVPSCTRC